MRTNFPKKTANFLDFRRARAKNRMILELSITESYQNDNFLPKWLQAGSKRYQNGSPESVTAHPSPTTY
jgi:hypothetical protein